MTKTYDVLSSELINIIPKTEFKPKLPGSLIVSKFSAFTVHRKRMYDEFKEMDENPDKPIELWEDANKTRDEISMSSSLSMKSFFNSDPVNHEESKIENSPKVGFKKRDEKLKTKTSEFRSYQELKMNEREEYYARELMDMNQK